MKVSVITATWNSGKTLRTTLDSVLNQSYPDIEHIIVDGGSTDNTMEIIREYEPRYNGRLRYISEPDKGLYDAMNKAVSYANGEWIIFMNAGDTFYTNDILSSIFNAETIKTYNSYGILYGDRCNIYHNRHEIIPSADIHNIEKYMPFCHQATLTRTHLLHKMPFDTRYKLGADYDFFLKNYRNGVQFKKLNICLANYEAEQGVSTIHLRLAKTSV